MIEIIDYKAIGRGTFLAIITLKLPKMANFIIRNVLVFGKNGHKWVVMPSKEYEKDGQKKFFPLVAFEDPAINKRFQETILKTYDEYIIKQGTINLNQSKQKV